jgi:hypothetical protein
MTARPTALKNNAERRGGRPWLEVVFAGLGLRRPVSRPSEDIPTSAVEGESQSRVGVGTTDYRWNLELLRGTKLNQRKCSRFTVSFQTRSRVVWPEGATALAKNAKHREQGQGERLCSLLRRLLN